MNWQQAALAVLVGAVIGYVTNWIAIRMLFRPLYERKLLGMPVPFTPGVIPRGKTRLAIGIGDAVGGLLLTEEKVVQHLLRPDSEEKVRHYLDNRLAEMRERDATVGETFALLPGEQPAADLKQWLATIAVNVTQSDEFRRIAARAAADLTGSLLEKQVGPSIAMIGHERFRGWLEQITTGLLEGETGDNFRIRLITLIENFLNSPKTIREYLPEALIEGLHHFIDDQAPRIGSAIEEYLSSKSAHRAIKNRINHFFEGTALKRMLNGVFSLLGTGSDALTDKLAAEISMFLADEQNQAEIIRRLHQLADEAMEKSITDISAALDETGKREKAGEIAAWLLEKLRDPGLGLSVPEIVEQLVERNSAKTWREIFCITEPGPWEELVSFFDRLFQKAQSSEGYAQRVKQLAERSVDGLLQAKMSYVLELLPAEVRENPGYLALGLYRFLVQRQVPGVVKFLDLNGMIRRQVEELDVLQVEELLLGIMRRELVAITWLGGLLGAVLGLVIVGMQYLAK